MAEPTLTTWAQVPQADILVPEGVLYSVAYVNNEPVAEIAGVPDDAPATGRTGGVSVRLPAEWEAQASGKQIRVTVRASATDPGAMLGVAYTTMEVGNSGWRQFTLTPEPTDYTFTYNVATMQNGNRDFLAFRSYGDARVQVAGYRMEVIGPAQPPATSTQ